MRKSLLLLLAVCCAMQLSAQFIITEIMYNPPESGNDSLEYVEIYNDWSSDVDLAGYEFIAGIEHVFTTGTVPAGGYHIVSVNSNALMSVLGVASEQWDSGALSNGGEEIAIKDPNGSIIDFFTFETTGDWPGSADGTNGEGSSIELCDLTLNNSLGENWGVSANDTGVELNGRTIKGTPGLPNECKIGGTTFTPMSISDVTINDADGLSTSIGMAVELTGIVHGSNFFPGGIQYTLIDVDFNEGIGLFNSSENFDDAFVEGNEVTVRGLVSQFRGVTQLNVEEVDLIGTGSSLQDVQAVTALDESTESSLIIIENVDFIDASQWLGDGSSFNVEVTDGTNNYQVRIHENSNLSNLSIPEGLKSITGIGGQFDQDAPFDSGYLLLPRYVEDIDADMIGGSGGGDDYMEVEITDINGEEADGSASSNGMKVKLTATAYGINFRPGGLQFTIIDNSNNGIGLFSNDENWGYNFTEGDELTVWGTVGQFSGLTQVNLDSIELVSQGNQLLTPTEITEISEATESAYISYTGLNWVDPAEWLGDGSSFNAEMTNGTTTITVRVDSDSPWSSSPRPDGASIVTGIGGQFDSSAPFDEGYQFLALNFEPYLSTAELEVNVFDVFPNPTQDVLTINSDLDFDQISIYNLTGQQLLKTASKQIDVSNFKSGNYIVLVRYENKFSRELFTKF